MKTAKLTNFTTADCGQLISILGGVTVLYRDKPLTSVNDAKAVRKEIRENKVDSVFFDTGALDSRHRAYAKLAVEGEEDLKVLIFNFPKNGV